MLIFVLEIFIKKLYFHWDNNHKPHMMTNFNDNIDKIRPAWGLILSVVKATKDNHPKKKSYRILYLKNLS